MGFLPEDEAIKGESGQFVKLEEGEHRFRALDKAIVGWVAWDKTGDKPKPMRIKNNGDFPVGKISEEPKRFWMFPVYNNDLGKIQTLEITQKSIMKALMAFIKDEDFGDPQNYDIVISRSGKTLADTEYTVLAKPPKPIDSKIKIEFKTMKSDGRYDIERVYDGEYPLTDNNTESNKNSVEEPEEKINLDDIPY